MYMESKRFFFRGSSRFVSVKIHMFFEFINMKEQWREQAARMMGGYLI